MFGSKFKFAWNQNKVQFKMPHFAHKISKNFRGDTPNPCCGRGDPLPYLPSARPSAMSGGAFVRHHSILTLHFQIPSAVYALNRHIYTHTDSF